MVIFYTFFALMHLASYGLVVTVLHNSFLPIVCSVRHAKTAWQRCCL